MSEIARTDRLVLRKFKREEAATVFEYRSDPEVARYQGWAPANSDAIAEYFDELTEREPATPGDWYQIAIALASSDLVVGDLAVQLQPHDERQAEIGVTLSREHQRQGFATEALHALLGFLFEECHLHRVIAMVDPRNLPSLALLKRLGMRQEGHLVESTWDKGEWTDDVMFAMLRREFERT